MRRGREPVGIIFVAGVEFDQIAAGDVVGLVGPGQGDGFMALLVLVEDDALQMIRIEIGVGIGLPVFLVQVGDLNGPSLYIDPLGEQIQTLVAAVEIEVDELLAGGILETEALRGLVGIVLPGLGGISEIGDQGIFCAAIHFQKRVVPVQLEVVGTFA